MTQIKAIISKSTNVVLNIIFVEDDYEIEDDCFLQDVGNAIVNVGDKFENDKFTLIEPLVQFTPEDVKNYAEYLIGVGIEINGIRFKTDGESIQRLRELIDGFNYGMVDNNTGKTYSTDSGHVIKYKTKEDAEYFYKQAIKWRSFVLERSSVLQNLTPIPDIFDQKWWRAETKI